MKILSLGKFCALSLPYLVYALFNFLLHVLQYILFINLLISILFNLLFCM